MKQLDATSKIISVGDFRKHGASPHAVTLAWVRSKGTTVVPILAARSEEHAVDSARSIGLTLTPEEIAAIDDADFSRA